MDFMKFGLKTMTGFCFFLETVYDCLCKYSFKKKAPVRDCINSIFLFIKLDVVFMMHFISFMGENTKLGNTSVRVGCPNNIANVIRPNNYIYLAE